MHWNGEYLLGHLIKRASSIVSILCVHLVCASDKSPRRVPEMHASLWSFAITLIPTSNVKWCAETALTATTRWLFIYYHSIYPLRRLRVVLHTRKYVNLRVAVWLTSGIKNVKRGCHLDFYARAVEGSHCHIALADHHFLHPEDLCQRNLHSQVPACHLVSSNITSSLGGTVC